MLRVRPGPPRARARPGASSCSGWGCWTVALIRFLRSCTVTSRFRPSGNVPGGPPCPSPANYARLGAGLGEGRMGVPTVTAEQPTIGVAGGSPAESSEGNHWEAVGRPLGCAPVAARINPSESALWREPMLLGDAALPPKLASTAP